MLRRRARLLSYLLLATCACGQDGTVVTVADAGATDAPALPAEASADALPSAEAATTADTPAVEARVAALLAQMTLDEKVGQMMMVDWTSLASTDDITTYGLGAPSAARPTDIDADDWLALASTVRAEGAATRLGIPLLFGIDAVHGNAKVRAPPSSRTTSASAARAIRRSSSRSAAATAAEVRGARLHDDLQRRTSDVGHDERWGRTYESFGEDPALVSAMADRGDLPAARRGAVLAVREARRRRRRHDVGHRRVTGGIDQGDARSPRPRCGACTCRRSRRR